MSTLHEQAQAEQRREYGSVWDVLVPEVGRTVGWIIEGVIDDVVAAHTRVVTTVDELNALAVGSVVLDRHGEAWRKTRTGDWTATALGSTTSSGVPLPARVLYEPEASQDLHN
jgi:hypothetical protein